MKQTIKHKIINIVGYTAIGLIIVILSVMTYVYFQHKQYKTQRLENNATYPKSWSDYNHPRCHEGNFFSTLFKTEK